MTEVKGGSGLYDPEKPYKYEIIRLIRSTWNTPYVDVREGSPYPISKRKKRYESYSEVDHTDGIGTKGIFHWDKRTFRQAAQDALAMNLNDLLMVRAIPYKLQNQITLPKDDHEAILEIVGALTDECGRRDIAVTGGETSIHSNVDALDISITVNGLIEREHENQCKAGDVLVGIASNGIHSNGMTKARSVFNGRYRKEFTVPTRIYYDEVMPVLKRHTVHGMMHITGGAFTKLRDILGDTDAVIDQPKELAPHTVFKDMFVEGVKNEEMYTTFNCGIGFVLSVPAEEVNAILSKIKGASVIGSVQRGSGKVYIKSAFNGQEFVL